jgi:iron complex transport system substrate-binding protein
LTGCYLSLLLPGLAAAALPSVASINLCTDQLVLSIADPAQIKSVSWLAADPNESMFAAEASRYALNYGSAEELIGIDADVVIAGTETSPFTRRMLDKLGFAVVAIAPADTLAEVARNLEQVGAAIGRTEAAARAMAAMRTRAAAFARAEPGAPDSAVVVRPGGFTIGRDTLAFELLELAGLKNSIAELDRWGSLSIEALLTERPDYLVLAEYRTDEASLANEIFAHRALAAVVDSQRTLSVHARYFSCGAPASLDAVDSLLEQMAAR